MAKRLLLSLLAAALLAGCGDLYPSFDASVRNDSGEVAEVRVTVWDGDAQAFQAERAVETGTTWEAGVFTRSEGEYRIVAESGGRVVAEATRRFGHDEGPGGFTVRLGSAGAEIQYWFN